MRIIAGEFGGRELLSPKGSDTRPITGLVKKSLFDSLGARLDGAAVADLYCGTGTIGLEALSRGAASCRFAERDRRAADLLRQNIETLGVADRCIIWQGDLTAGLRRRLATMDCRLDIAFVDPPYEHVRRWDWQKAAEDIFAPLAEYLAPSGLVILRVPAKVIPPQPLGPLSTVRQRKYGDMELFWLGLVV